MDKELPEFQLKENYPLNREGVFNFYFITSLEIVLLIGNYFINNVFFNLLISFAVFLSILMTIVLYQSTFSLDERYLNKKDKKRFLSFCQKFPYELKRDFLSHLDFDRISLKDVKELNKNIKLYNKYIKNQYK